MGSAPYTAGTSRRSARRSPPLSPSRSLSREAEDQVARALAERGWEILARNVRYVGSELDLVAKKGRTLAIVEVKARRGAFAPDPGAFLPRRKLAALKRGALAFMTATRADVDTVRLDLAIVQSRSGVAGTFVTYHAGIFWD